jgi:hypothetical protein
MIACSEWKLDNIFKGIAEQGNAVFFDANPEPAQGPGGEQEP